MSGSASDRTARFAEAASEIAALADEAVAEGTIDALDDEALGQALAAAVRLYVAKAETGARLMPFGRNAAVTPTEIAVAAMAMLDAGRMEVFELGLWEQWSNIRPARQTSLANVEAVA
ncbi:hypothetical protein HKCCE2091_17790 [Rhodobacterales bacterium HKCCE2091]|nr:hypothetical protein [Rhodobacterales bacterium HKCCE2091]